MQLLRVALDGEINPTVSRAILDEMVDVLAREFGASPEAVAEATAIVKEAARTVTTVELNVTKDDRPDNRVLECAVSAGADHSVTGDKDLLRLKQYGAIQINSVVEFLEIAKHARGV